MKKILFPISFIALSAVFVACEKEIERNDVSEEGFTYVFNIGNADTENDDTKASLGTEDSKALIQWANNDQIGTTAGGTNGYSQVKVSAGTASFSIYSTSAIAVDSYIYCHFPYTTNQEYNNLSMSIPASQNMTSSGFNVTAMPMVSIPFKVESELERSNKYSTVGTINFVNLGSLIDFRIYTTNDAYNTEKVKTVKFESTGICGDFTFTGAASVDYNNKSTLAIPAVTGTTVTTSFDTPATVGGNKASAIHAYMVVAPGTHAGTVTVETDVATYTYNVSSKDFKRAALKPLNVDLKNAATREINGYEIPVTINFKDDTNTEYVRITGADYYSANANAFYGSTLRFDASNEQIIIPTKAAFGDISIVALYNTSSTPTSTLKIYGSADGSSYTEIGTPSFTHGANVADAPDAVIITNTESSYRYIKMVFTKGTGNLAVGSITLAAPDTDPRIAATDISDVAAAGVENAPATYTVYNFADDVEVSNVTGCVSDALAMDGDIVYTVTPNYTGAVRNGTIVLASAGDPSVTKTINVTQAADVFSVSTTSVLVGKGAGSTETFTVTSTYAFTVESSDTGVLTVSPASASGSDSPQTITVTAVAANGGAEKLLGTVTVTRTVDDNDELEVAVNQQAGNATFALTLSFPDENSDNNKVQVYTATKVYKITLGGTEYSWSIANFNNNNWANSWTYIRGGAKAKTAGTAVTWEGSISTTTVIAAAISEVIVDYARITVGSGSNTGTITEAKLEVSTSSDFSAIAETVYGIPTATGEYTYTITSPVANAYYRLSYATSNKSTTAGVIQIDSIQYNE